MKSVKFLRIAAVRDQGDEDVYSYRLTIQVLAPSADQSCKAASPAVKAPILGEACIRVRIKYFYSFMTFGPY